MVRSVLRCRACGEICWHPDPHRPVCRECERELVTGVVRPPGNVEFFFERGYDPFEHDNRYHGQPWTEVLVDVVERVGGELDEEASEQEWRKSAVRRAVERWRTAVAHAQPRPPR